MVKFSQSRASLFAINFDAGEASVHRVEGPMSAAAQPQPASAVISGNCFLTCIFGNGTKKILADKQILDAIAVEITDVNGKHRRKLCFARQRRPFEMRPAVEKYPGPSSVA